MDQQDLIRKRILLEKDHVSHTSSTDFPGNYPNIPHQELAWNLEHFKKNCKLVFHKKQDDLVEFDLIGVDAAIANALRRIMIAEVPTMAIEHVFIYKNTGVMQDEVLAHRLGLMPIKVDPTKFDMKREGDAPTDLNTIVFRLQVTCQQNPKAHNQSVDPKDQFINSSVYSGSIKFFPQGDQAETFGEDGISMVHDKILVTKLRPKQSLDMELHAVKGIGKDHAKFSPVATATYRLMPDIIIKEPILGEDAEKFVKCFPPGVADVFKNKDGELEAKIVNARNDTMSREVLRHPEFADKVLLTRVRDHFIFTVESTGCMPAIDIVRQSIQILKEKCTTFKEELSNYTQ